MSEVNGQFESHPRVGDAPEQLNEPAPEQANESGRILLLASKLGYQTRGFAEAARRLGVEVTTGSDRCHQLEDPWADGAIALHFEEPQASAETIVRAVRSKPVQAILALGDRQTVTAAYAARALGLPYNSPKSVENCRSKLRQRELLRSAGLAVPDFFSFELPKGGNSKAAGMFGGERGGEKRGEQGGFDMDSIVRRVTFPCVVKPLRLSASQGVIRANNAHEFKAAVARISRLLNSPEVQVTREGELDRLLVERYIPGVEVALEGLLERGRLRVLALFDKPDELEGPYFEESIYVTPSRLPEEMRKKVIRCAEETVRALGLTHGPVHAEFRIGNLKANTSDGARGEANSDEGSSGEVSSDPGAATGADVRPWILEAAPRPIGGLCSRALRFGAGRMLLEELLVRHAMRMGGSDQQREELAAGVMMIPVPGSGILEAVEGVEEAVRTPGVDDVQITARLHDFIAAWPEGSSYLGFIFARAERPAEVEAALRRAHGQLRIRITPRLPVAHPASQGTAQIRG